MRIIIGFILGVMLGSIIPALYRDQKWSIWNEAEFDKYQTIEKEKYLLFKIEQDKENSKK